MRLRLCLAGVFVFFVQLLKAQDGDLKIVGNVLDAGTKQPIEYAAISLNKLPDSSIVTGVITDENGKFVMPKLNPGNYFIKVNYVGYNPLIKDVVLNEDTKVVNTGIIGLVNSGSMKSVVIQGTRPFMQTDLDKKVYNVDKTIVAQSGSAADVLQTIPSVTIDMDGNVSLRGNSGVKIFIDGKPSGIMGDNMEAILQQIPANSIENIEVITNPSAKYDAEGTAGIINIVLKKNKQTGFNGNISGDYGTAPKYDASATLNYRSKKINVSSNYSYGYDNRDGYGNSERYNFFTDTSYYYNSQTNSNNISHNNFAKLGLDYYINHNNTISLSGSYSDSRSNSFEDLGYNFFDASDIFSGSNERLTNTYDSNYSYSLSLDYKKLYKNPKQQWTASAYYTYGARNTTNNYNTKNFDVNSIQLGDAILQNIMRNGNNDNFILQSDYVQPYKDGHQLEAGVKATSRSNNNTIYSETMDSLTDTFIEDTSISNDFTYGEDVYAGYMTFGGALKKINYKIGLRGEQTFTNAQLITTDQNFKNNYFSIFPSLHLSHDITKDLELTASYSRRINRPMGMQLNPFPDYNDAFSLREGNPFLDPEFIDSYEFGVNKTWKNHSLYSTLYYHQTNNAISRIIIVDTTGVAISTFANANTERSYGAEFILSDQFFKWWTSTTSLNFFQSDINATNIEAGLTNNTLSWSGKVMWNFQIMQQTSLQISGNYMSPWVMPQGKSLPMYFADAGAKSDFFKNTLSVSVTMNDIFNTKHFGMTSDGINYTSDFYRKRTSQILTLQATYRFGSQGQFKNRFNRGNQNGDQQPDMNNTYDY